LDPAWKQRIYKFEVFQINIIIDKLDSIWVVYDDLNPNSKGENIKKYRNGSWYTQGDFNFKIFFGSRSSISFDTLNNPWIIVRGYASFQKKISIFKLDSGIWKQQGNSVFNIVNHDVGNLGIEINKQNTPFILFNHINSPKVMQLVADTWSYIGNMNGSVHSKYGVKMKLNKDGWPFMVYSDDLTADKIMVLEFKNNIWNMLGTYGISQKSCIQSDIAVDSSGIPWVVYVGDDFSIGVRKFINDSWITQGNIGLNLNRVYFADIKFDSKNKPWVILINDSFIQACKFENDVWVKIAEKSIDVILYDSQLGFNFSVTMSNKDVIWVSYIDNSKNNALTVLNLENNNWKIKGNAGFSKTNVTMHNITTDSSGKAWVGYYSVSKISRGEVLKFENDTWSNYGNYITTSGLAKYLHIKFDKMNTLFAVYNETVNQDYYSISVKKMVNNAWVLVGKSGIGNNPSSSGTYAQPYLKLGFDTLNNPWLLYQTWIRFRVMLTKFEKGSWKQMNESYISAAESENGKFLITPKGKMYISYQYGGLWVKEYKIPSAHQLEVYGNKKLIYPNDTLSSTIDSTNMGTIGIENKVKLKFKILNGGYENLTFIGTPKIEISGINASEFKVLTSLPNSLKPKDSIWIAIEHTPNSYGAKSALVTIKTNDDVNSDYSFTIGSEVLACKSNNPIANEKGYLYRSAFSETDNNGWTCFCDSTGLLLMSLNFVNTGALITSQQVFLKLGKNSTFSSDVSGGIIKNNDGYTLIDRRWHVFPTNQPNKNKIGVRYFFSSAELLSIQNSALNQIKPTTIDSAEDLTIYQATSGLAFSNPHLVNGITFKNDIKSSTSTWKNNKVGNNYFAEFEVEKIYGGAIGVGANGGSRSRDFKAANPDIDIKGNGITIRINDTLTNVLNNTDFGNCKDKPKKLEFEIENKGFKKLILTNSYIEGLNYQDYTISNLPDSVSMGKTKKFYITFNSKTEGLKKAKVYIESNGFSKAIYTFNIQANRIKPEINILGNNMTILNNDKSTSIADSTNFGLTNLDQVFRSFVIQNLGSDTLLIDSINLIGPNSGDFFVVSFPKSILSNSSEKFYVVYNSLGNTVSKASIVIFNNDENEGIYSFDIEASKNKTNLSKISMEGVSVYPNPVSSNLIIFMTPKHKCLNVSLYSSNGMLILEEIINHEINSIDMSKLSNGLYFVKLFNHDFSEVIKIIKN
jgi:hypothetical protein